MIRIETKHSFPLNHNKTTTTPLFPMSIILTPEQEQLIQAQLASGRYANTAEVIADALRLLEKRNQYNLWVEEVRAKIDIAAAQLDRGEGVDGETAIAQLRAKLYK
jgi:antitoxin ParD1/3/4